MSTSSKFANLTENQLVTKETLKDNIFDYLSNKISNASTQLYKNQGVIGDKLVLSTVDTDATNTTLTISGTSLATDGLGNLFDTDSTYSYCDSVKVHASVAGQKLDVALRYNYGPAFGGTESNVRTNEKNANAVEYIAHREYIGEKGSPDSLSLIGSSITLNVSSLCMASHSYADRKCLVYLKTPVTTVEAVAIQVLTISWDGTYNTVNIASNKLGQGTPSADVDDYECIVLGPTLSDNETNTLNGVSPYFFVGTLTAGTVWTSDNTLQNDYEVALDSIQEEVDKFNRVVTVNYTGATFTPGRKTSKPVLTAGHCSTTYADEIYVFGGSNDDGFLTNTQNAYKYTPADGSWTALTSMPDAYTRGCSAFTIGNKIYIIGGFNSSGVATNAVRIYDISGNSYSAGSTTGFTAMGRGVGGVIDGKIYYGGGQTELDVSVSTNFYVYDPVADTWTTRTAVPGNVSGGSFCIYKDKLYVVGGGADMANINENNYTYDYASNSWATNELSLFDSTNDTELGVSTSDRSYRYTALSWVKDGLMYIYQGEKSTRELWVLSIMHIIDLEDFTKKPVEVIPPYVPILREATANVIDGHVFIVGGMTYQYWKNNNDASRVEELNRYDICMDLNYVFKATKDIVLNIPSFKLTLGDDWKNLIGNIASLTLDSIESVVDFDNQYNYDKSGTIELDSFASLGYNIWGQTGYSSGGNALSIGYINSTGLACMSFGYTNYGAGTEDDVGLIICSPEDRIGFVVCYDATSSDSSSYHVIDDKFNIGTYKTTGPVLNETNIRKIASLTIVGSNSVSGAGSGDEQTSLFKTKDLDLLTNTETRDIIDAGTSAIKSCDWYPGLQAGHYKKYPPMQEEDFNGTKTSYHKFELSRDYHIPSTVGWYYLGYTKCKINTGDNTLEQIRLSGTKDFRVRNFTKNDIYRPLVHFDDQRILIPKGDLYGDIYVSSQWDFEYYITGGE